MHGRVSVGSGYTPFFFCLGGCLVVCMGFLSLSSCRSEIVANSGISLCSLFVRWVLPSCLDRFFYACSAFSWSIAERNCCRCSSVRSRRMNLVMYGSDFPQSWAICHRYTPAALAACRRSAFFWFPRISFPLHSIFFSFTSCNHHCTVV